MHQILGISPTDCMTLEAAQSHKYSDLNVEHNQHDIVDNVTRGQTFLTVTEAKSSTLFCAKPITAQQNSQHQNWMENKGWTQPTGRIHR